MKSITFSIILVLGIITNSFAQNYSFPWLASDSVTWKALNISFWGGDGRTLFYEYEQATVNICGTEYSQVKDPIITHLGTSTLQGKSYGYVRSDSLKTYVRLDTSCAAHEYVMYDFSLAVGDSITVAAYQWGAANFDTVLLYVDTIQIESWNGIDRRTLYLDPIYNPNYYNGYGSMRWIEGIGSDEHPFYSMTCISGGCEESFNTLCVDSNGTELYRHPLYDTCEVIIIGVPETNNKKVQLYPTVSNGSYTIELDEQQQYTIQVYDLNGTLVYHSNGGGRKILNLEHLNNGMYVIRVGTQSEWYTARIVKQSY